MGAGPSASCLSPHPHIEPIVSQHKGPTQAHCYPFMGTGHPRGGLCQASTLPHWPAREWGAYSFPTPKRGQRVWQDFKTTNAGWNMSLYANPWNEPPLPERKKSPPLALLQMKTANICVSAWGPRHPSSADGTLAAALGAAQRFPLHTSSCFLSHQRSPQRETPGCPGGRRHEFPNRTEQKDR